MTIEDNDIGRNAARGFHRTRSTGQDMSIRPIATTSLAALALVMCASLALAQMVLEVIPLHHRTAEELIPILQPMLARGGAFDPAQRRRAALEAFVGSQITPLAHRQIAQAHAPDAHAL